MGLDNIDVGVGGVFLESDGGLRRFQFEAEGAIFECLNTTDQSAYLMFAIFEGCVFDMVNFCQDFIHGFADVVHGLMGLVLECVGVVGVEFDDDQAGSREDALLEKSLLRSGVGIVCRRWEGG